VNEFSNVRFPEKPKVGPLFANLGGLLTSLLYGLPRLRNPFVCTVRLAREVLGLYPTNLPRVCRALRIPLRHHHAGSDAAAAARIALTAARSIGVATAETLARRYGE